MTGISDTRRAAVLAALVVFMLAVAVARPAGAQSSDDCTPPQVGVVNTTPADEYGLPAGEARSAQFGEAIINDAIASNKGSVRFFQDIRGGGLDVDYTLTVTGGTGDDGAGSSASLDDQKGRNVASGSGAAADIAAQLSPMLDKIRDHQRRIRDQEKSAIEPKLTMTPGSQTIKVGETATINIEIMDCDGVALEREAGIELEGPGSVTPQKVNTAGAVQYKGSAPGTARLTGFWKYETVASISNLVSAAAVVVVTGEGGTGEQTAARPKGSRGATVEEEKLKRSNTLLERSRQLMDM